MGCAGQSQATGFAPRSGHPVPLSWNVALQASLGGLVREGTWRFPPVGLSSPAGICPGIWRSYPISRPAFSKPSQCVSIATGSGAAASTGPQPDPVAGRIAHTHTAAVPEARLRYLHEDWLACSVGV